MVAIKRVHLGGSTRKILELLENHHEGMTTKQLLGSIKVSRQNLERRLYRLIGLGRLEKIGKYGAIWRGCNSSVGIPKGCIPPGLSGNIQLHDFSLVVRLVDKPKWWDKRENRIARYGFGGARWVRLRNHGFVNCEVRGWVVQMFNSSLIFMRQGALWGKTPFEVYNRALLEFFDVLGAVQRGVGFVFVPDGVPNVSLRSDHFVHVRDVLARKFVDEGRRFEVVVGGVRRLWVDLSDPLGMEAGSRDYGLVDMARYLLHFRDIVENEPFLASTLSKKSVEHEVDLMKIKRLLGLLPGIPGGVVGEADSRVAEPKPDYFG